MRPLFWMAPEESIAYSHRLYSYLLGGDLLVAPVVQPGADSRRLWLPEESWIHLWTGGTYSGGWVEVPAPIGKPPVFYRKGSAFSTLFTSLREPDP